MSDSLGVTESGGQRREITVIEAGWGSSGYYAREVLVRDIPTAFPVGTHMYLNHPTESEDAERPERDVRDLAAVITRQPYAKGDAMVAECEVFEHYAPLIDAIAPHIGTSIRAMGEAEQGEAEGRTGAIIRSLDEGISLDFVTHAGAGGKVGARLLESARGIAGTILEEARNAGEWLEASIHREFTLTADSLFGNGYVTRDERRALSSAIGSALESFTSALQDSAPGLYERDPYADLASLEIGVSERKADEFRETRSKEAEMADADELAVLKESISKLEAQVGELTESTASEKTRADRAEDALARTRAEAIIAGAKHTPDGADQPVSVFEGLPAGAVDRVKDVALKGDLPFTEDGKLNEDALIERTRDAAKAEREYLVEAGVKIGGGRPAQVVGMGSVHEAGTSNNGSRLEESFGRLGLDKDKAAIAAGGR